mmetsp:Transcript_46662/g.123238  ORF Transcript_46662/g.123238 Transcript_46662/m.123238 type:complete len:208 (-) Transcript_46662:75-698(-)
MAPSFTTSMMSAPLRPTSWPTARPSQSATRLVAMMVLTTSFILAPAPTSPRKKVRLPMMSKQGWASSHRALSPAERITSWPLRAGPLEPLTGASRNLPPFATMAAPISHAVSTSMVDMSMYFLPGAMPASTPFSPKTTARADSGSEVQANVRSHASISFCAVSASLAPFATSAFTSGLSWERFQMVTGYPASMRRPAMAEPMMPMPR